MSSKSKRGSLEGIVPMKDRLAAYTGGVSGKSEPPRDVSVMSPGERALLNKGGKAPPASSRGGAPLAQRKAALGNDAAAKSPAEADTPTGAEIHSGWLKRGGTGMLSALYSKRFVVLHADPLLAFYEDEARLKPKGTWRLSAGTRVSPDAADNATIETPSDDGGSKPKALRLRAINADGPAWWLKLQAAVDAALSVAATPALAVPAAAPVAAPVATPAEAAAEAAEAADAAPPMLGKPTAAGSRVSVSRPMHSSGQLVGGIELGGEADPAPDGAPASSAGSGGGPPRLMPALSLASEAFLAASLPPPKPDLPSLDDGFDSEGGGLPLALDGFRWPRRASESFGWLLIASDCFRWPRSASDGF